MRSNYRPDIDGLHAVAVLSIVLFHLEAPHFGGGFAGVDIFFVISGLLITRLIKEEIDLTSSFNVKKFYSRRVRRLFPAQFVTLVVTTILSIFFLSPVHLQSFGGSLTFALASVSNMFFWMEADYFDVSARAKPLLHIWSLSVEEQFYLIWPFTFVLLYKFNKWILLIALIFISLLSLSLSVTISDGSVAIVSRCSPTLADLISNGRATIFFLLPFRFFEFAIGGAIVCLGKYHIKNIILNEILFFLGILLVFYAVFLFDSAMLYPTFWALFPCVGTALLIYSGENSLLSSFLKNKYMVSIGLISYSLYLVHWPLIVFWSYFNPALGLIDKVSLAVLSFFIAHLSYIFIETPFRYNSIRLGIKKKLSCISFAVLLVAAVGFHMKINNGWPWRVSFPVSFENVGDAARSHKDFYGGAGYQWTGPVNSENPPDIVLMGDSHGRHYAEGIYKELAEPEGKTLYLASGASFLHLPHFIRTTKGEDWASIVPTSMNLALSFIDNAFSPPLVIISHAWLSQMRRADMLDEHGKHRNIHVDVQDIIQGIRALKQRIGDSTLIVIGEVPGSGNSNLYDVFTRPIPLFFSDFNPDNYLRTPLDEAKINFNEFLLEAANSTGDFLFLDPHDVLCKDGLCRNTDDQNRLIYSDANHLSKYGSREIIRAFLPKIKQAGNTHESKNDDLWFSVYK